jgi:hypothetical protein
MAFSGGRLSFEFGDSSLGPDDISKSLQGNRQKQRQNQGAGGIETPPDMREVFELIRQNEHTRMAEKYSQKMAAGEPEIAAQVTAKRKNDVAARSPKRR